MDEQENEQALPLEPLAMLVFEDGSVRVTTIEEAIDEMERYPGIIRSYAFMGAEFALNEEDEDESLDAED